MTIQTPGGVTITRPVSGSPAPLSIAELRARRSEISSQLGNVTDRRAEIAAQLRNAAPGADKAGLEARVSELDARIVQLEKDLASTGRDLATARGLETFTEEPPPQPGNAPNRGQITAIAIVFTVVVLAPLAWAWARAILRRSTKQAEQPSKHLMDRLDRMEEGIETIALEVERISEGQRFVTRVIGESRGEPLAIPRGESS